MPLHGKIVVVKRSGGDGTEFPLTASCLFGRKPDCDIRIQLPQVSKEHCRIDLNENKEVILTNLSSVNPTCVNGEVLQQPERLKNGDVITIVDRSFRFEYPPAPTPKKSIKGSKGTTPDHHLKDGTNHNIQRSLEQTKGEDPTEDADTQQSKTVSPFNELYQMIRESLGVKTTPYKSAGVRIQTPLRKSNVSTKGTPKVAEATVSRAEAESENTSNAIPTSDLKRRTSDVKTPAKNAANIKPDASSPQTRQRVTPQTLNVSDVAERVCTPTPKSPMRRRSKEATPPKQHDKVMSSPQNTKSPGVIGKGVPKKRKSEELDSPASQTKKKRVSFGGYLVPELFDKKMPPDSPLRKGENPRRSLCLSRPKQSLLRRASIIGLLNVAESPTKKSSGSPKVSQKKSTKGSSPSPGKKSPKSRTPPHKSPKSTPAKSPSPSTPSASRCSSEMTLPWTPLPKSAKSTPTSSQRASPAIKSLKPNMLSAIVTMLGDKTPKSRSSPTFSEKTSKTPSTKSPKSTPVSPKLLSLTPKLNTQSVEASLLVEKSPKWRSSYPASSEATSKLSTPRRRSSSSKKLETPLTVGPSCKETPTSTKRASPRPSTQGMGNKTPATTPLGSQMNVSSAQGRFSISRIETPSPMAEVATVDPAQSATVTPKIPLRRKSMKSSARKTSLAKSAIRVMIRRSGISRASMKAITSWADTVKFGQVKVQPPFPAKKIVKSNLATTRVVKKMVSRPQTPRRKQLAHASTGHAESPVTIVIGRAFKQKVTPPTGAAPKVTCNTLISKENMKMDEDLSGITEMFKTPVKEAERRSEANKSTTKGPLLVNEPSVLEPSVLNTPEEPGEMVVSPLTLASTRKAGRYNKEAVKRLLNCSQEFSFNSDLSGMQTRNDSVEEQCTGVKASDVATPKQKPQPPECLTGVRRLMKTPRQKAEPAEDLGGKLLKTPKQKIEQQECLTGVKRMMRTPRQKTEPVEDLRGKLLKTPKQQSEQKECLTGVKRIFNTLKQSECIRGVSIVGQNWKEGEVADVSLSGIPDLLDTAAKDSHNLPTPATESQDLPEQTKSATPGVSNSPIANLAGTKRVMKTPKQKSAPVEDIFGIERLMKTPKVRSEPVEENFGIKQLMKSPRLRGRAPLEDFEGLQELMEEPVEFKDQPASCYLDETKGQPEEIVSSGVTRDMPQVDITKEITEVLAEVPNVASESSDTEEAVSQTVIEDAPRVTEMDMASLESANTMKSVQGERTKVEDEPMGTKSSSDPVVSAPVRGRRGKNVERTEPPAEEAVAAPKTKRGKYARKVETVQQTLPEPEIEQSLPVDNEPAMNNSVGSLEKEAVKPRRGRYAKKVETVQQVAPATFPEPEIEHSLPVDIEPAMNKGVKPLGKEAVKPRRGRSAKKASEQIEKVPEAAAEALSEPDSEPSPSENIEHLMSDSSTPLEKVAARPKRCAKNASEPIETTALAATETLPEPKSEQTLAVDSEPVIDQSVAPLESESVKPKRGRYPKKVLEQTETIPVAPTEILPEPDIEPPVNENMAPLEEAVKPKRGRKPKHFSQSKEAQISSRSDVSQDNTAQVLESGGDHEELMPSEDQENKSSDPAKGLLEVKTATEKDLVVVQKPVRGRRGKLVEDTVEEEKQDAAFEEAHVSAPVRARRGKRTEATAPPAIRQSTRNRNAKTKEGASDAQSATVPEKDSELNLVTKTSETYTRQDVKKSDEDLVKKPGRGRRAKQTPIEPLQPKLEKTPESEQLFVSEQPLLPAPTDKTGRGKNVISETVELEELVEDEVISEETKLQSKPLARTRGRNAKHKKELDNSDSTSTLAHSLLQEIKTSSDQTVDVENPVQVQVDAPQLSEPEHMSENTSSSTKTRRGVVEKLKQEAVAPGLPESPDGPIETPTEKPKRGRRTKQVEDRTAPEKPEETNIGTRRGTGKATQEVAVESAENNDGPVETPTEKPKRGSRAKQVVTTSEVKEKPEPEQKRQRGRGLKANLENETPQVVLAKRARRGPAPASEEPKEVPEPASVEPVKRGRLQKLLRSVNWNPEVEVHEVPKRSTRVVRGKRSSPSDDAETRSQSESENADKTEEDLSEKAVESQPAKRARRGAKVANEAESTSKVATKEAQDTQAQPKTRKGRSAKK